MMEYNVKVIKQITNLPNLNKTELENMWQRFFDYPPEVNSRQYIISKLAYRIQELAYGSVNSETEKKIKAYAEVIETQENKRAKIKSNSMENSTKKSKKYSPMVGTKIAKEYRGKLHEVLVVTNGFAYSGEVFRSLSAIALKITGTKWNGLRFFGVKK